MAAMLKQVPVQLKFAVLIALIGGGAVGGEYFLVHWYPGHQDKVVKETLELLPYRNDGLGIDMKLAAGLYGRIENFPGGVKIMRSKFMGIGPSLTVTSQPNPDQSTEFSPQFLAKWQTDGVYQEIPRYRFEHTKINNRDAILIWQLRDRYMEEMARVVSPERLIEARCSVGQADEDLFLRACDESLRTIHVAGPEPTAPPAGPVEELAPASPKHGS